MSGEALYLGKGKVAAVVSALGKRIVAGEFPAGQPLPVETDLAEALQVGRSVLREAIKVLASKGMISVRPRHGTTILPRSQWNLFDGHLLHWMLLPELVQPTLLRDILDVRRIIEPAAARMAASNATAEDKVTLRAAYDAMAISVGDHEASVEADIQFHTAILTASHNAVLSAFAPALSAILSGFFRISIQNPEVFLENLPAHEEVTQQIEAQAPIGAEKAMVDLLSFTEFDLSSRLGL